MERFDGEKHGRDQERRAAEGHETKGRETEWRDTELGKELRRLEVPEHGPGFFADLEERLAAEAASRTATARSAATPARSAATPAGSRAAPVSSAAAAKPRRNWLRLAWIPIPAAAVVLLLLWALAGPLGIDSLRPETASAAEVSQKVVAAIAEADSLRGTLVIVSPGETDEGREEMRWSFVFTAEGDFRLTPVIPDPRI